MILVVDGQRVYNYSGSSVIASDSVEFVEIEFRFSTHWDGYIRVAQFTQKGNTYNKLLVQDKTKLPAEIVSGEFSISVFGYKSGAPNRGTTIPYCAHISKSGFISTAETPIPPTPDLYAQLLAQIQQGGSGSGYILPTATKQLLGGIKVGEDLKITADGTLSVDKVTEVADNTKPITAAAVYKEVGNINALLATI